MPAQPIVSKRVAAIHVALIDAGWGGKKLDRDVMEAYLARELGLSLPNIRVHIDMGRALGLWQLVDRRPRPGALLVLPQRPAEEVHSSPMVHTARS